MKTLLLADAQPLFRAGLATVFPTYDFTVVASAATTEDAVAAAALHRPDVCLLSVDLAGGVVAAIRRIVSDVPDTVIIVVAETITTETLLGSLRAGADGVLPKSTSATAFVRAVNGVLDGQAAIPRSALRSLVDELRGGRGRSRTAVGSAVVSLTGRELQVLQLLKEHRTTPQMAVELGVAQVTVRRHLAAIATKMDARGRVELLALVDAA